MAMRIGVARASVLIAALVLSACVEQEPLAIDYREKYPVQVTSEAVTVALPVPSASGTMMPEDEMRMGAVVAGYLDRGHGSLTLATGMRGSAPSFAELDMIRERLVAAGVPESSIRLVSVPQLPANVVTLRYERYNVVVPTCGDWSSHPAGNPLNDVHSNFGCANQRNTGLMVADPADLLRMREAAPTDTQTSNRVIQRHRKGDPTAATPTPLQIQGGAGITKTGQ
jgi:pilus biogenesis lipoprotein CpaD